MVYGILDKQGQESAGLISCDGTFVLGGVLFVHILKSRSSSRVESPISALSSPLGVQILLGLVVRLGFTVDSVFIDAKTVVLRNLLPGLELAVNAIGLLLELVDRRAELGDGLLGKKLLQRPFLDRLLLVFLELGDVANRVCQDGALVLLTPRNNLGQLIDSLIDGLAASTLNYLLSASMPFVIQHMLDTCLPCGCLFAFCATPQSQRLA